MKTGVDLMNERITFISILDDKNIEKIEFHTKKIKEKLCKVPFGKNVKSREKADTLSYHFTVSAWNISLEEKVLTNLKNIEFPKLKIYIDDIKIMNGKEKSYVLYFNIKENKELRLFQEKIYQVLPNEKYNPTNFHFHITIHIDKDYNKIIKMKEKLLKHFAPFELEIDTFGLYEIYPAKLVKEFKTNINL